MSVAGPDLCTVWVTFGPSRREWHPEHPQTIEFVKGSHLPFMDPRSRPYSSGYAAHAGELIPAVEAGRSDEDCAKGRGPNIISFDTELGDLVVFHPAILHGGLPNDSAGRRPPWRSSTSGPEPWSPFAGGRPMSRL